MVFRRSLVMRQLRRGRSPAIPTGLARYSARNPITASDVCPDRGDAAMARIQRLVRLVGPIIRTPAIRLRDGWRPPATDKARSVLRNHLRLDRRRSVEHEVAGFELGAAEREGE